MGIFWKNVGKILGKPWKTFEKILEILGLHKKNLGKTVKSWESFENL
jgi:hypothetical protein